MPAKALPNSLTVVGSASLSTDSTVSERLASSVSVAIGIRVSSLGDLGVVLEVGPSSACGWSSTYCSPTAERLPTTARVSAGISS